jgi:hypothetical protein
MHPPPTISASRWIGQRNAAGQYHGRGVLMHHDGGRTEGECVNGLLQGRGVETHPNGKRIEGEFVDGQMQGPGVIRLPDGTRCEGEFVRGNAHGRWLLTRPDGTRYERQYDNGTQLSEKVHPPDEIVGEITCQSRAPELTCAGPSHVE